MASKSVKKVSFKLNQHETLYADALRRQILAETGEVISLEDVIKRLFVNWMNGNLIQHNSNNGIEASIQHSSNDRIEGEDYGIGTQTISERDNEELQATSGSSELEQPTPNS